MVMEEEALRDMRSGDRVDISASQRGHGIDRSDMQVAAEGSGPPNYVGYGEPRQVLWHGMDGGVRPSGGRPGSDRVAGDDLDANFDSSTRYRLPHSTSSASTYTLPPSYSSN